MVQYGTLIFYGTVYFSLYYLLWYSAVLFVMSGLPLQVSLPLEVSQSDCQELVRTGYRTQSILPAVSLPSLVLSSNTVI